MTRNSSWFAFCDDETLLTLGEHEDFEGADAEESRQNAGRPRRAIWLFTDNSLDTLGRSIDEALRGFREGK